MTNRSPWLDWRCYAVGFAVALLSCWDVLSANPPFTDGIAYLGGAWLTSSIIVIAIWSLIQRMRKK